jgi:hypothetical protein
MSINRLFMYSSNEDSAVSFHQLISRVFRYRSYQIHFKLFLFLENLCGLIIGNMSGSIQMTDQ